MLATLSCDVNGCLAKDLLSSLLFSRFYNNNNNNVSGAFHKSLTGLTINCLRDDKIHKANKTWLNKDIENTEILPAGYSRSLPCCEGEFIYLISRSSRSQDRYWKSICPKCNVARCLTSQSNSDFDHILLSYISSNLRAHSR